MVDTIISIDEQIDFILDKVDNDMPLTMEERRFYHRHVMGIENDMRIEFILNGCDIPTSDQPTEPGSAYIV